MQASAATPMATVQQIDPIYVDLNQSSVEGLQLRRDVASGRLKLNGPDQAKVTLLLEDGTEYSERGTLQFTDITVDPGTGSVTVRAIFPNPHDVLLPGMFVRARIDQGVDDTAMLVPQVGVTHNPQGQATALIVGPGQQGGVAHDTGHANVGRQVGRPGWFERRRPGDRSRAAESTAGNDRAHRRSADPDRSGAIAKSMAKFFIERPIFAIVIAIMIMLAGGLSILTLPIERYPEIAPPTIQIAATYPGASAATLENTVVQVIEQQMNGLDNLLYMASTSDDAGQARTILTFAPGTSADIAQVQVQNKLQLAVPSLPAQVQQAGLRVTKSNSAFLMVAGFVSTDNSMSRYDIANYVVSNIVDPISRVNGVGDINVFGSQYAMRIWLDPNKLNAFALTPLDVTAAVQSQNVQVSGGQLGGTPAPATQRLNATITEATLLRTPQEFGSILLKVNPDGSQVRLRDVARIELGAENYNIDSHYNGQPASGMGINLATGANALATADASPRAHR